MHFLAFFLIYILIIIPLIFCFSVVGQPFRWFQRQLEAHALITARIVIGFIATGLLAHLFQSPYTLGVALGGGAVAWLLGEIL